MKAESNSRVKSKIKIGLETGGERCGGGEERRVRGQNRGEKESEDEGRGGEARKLGERRDEIRAAETGAERREGRGEDTGGHEERGEGEERTTKTWQLKD